MRAAGLLSAPDGDSTARVSTWMAPEQHEGQPPVPASDVYAVGRLLSLLLHGRLLPAVRSREDVESSDPLLRCVGRATAWDAADRFPDARVFATALERALEELSSGPIRRVSRAVGRVVGRAVGRVAGSNRARWGYRIGAALLVAATVVVALLAWSS